MCGNMQIALYPQNIQFWAFSVMIERYNMDDFGQKTTLDVYYGISLDYTER